MPLFVTYQSNRPNRLNDKKDKDYHVKYGRWALSSMNHPLQRRYITKTLVNWSFYKGGDGQWIYDEDLEAFFLDESGDVRNRLKIAKNLIRPMVEQYVGNAVRLDYDAGVESTSQFVIDRKDRELNRLKYYEGIVEQFPEQEGLVKDNVAIGDTPQETEELFANAFIDDYNESMNHLLQFIEDDININELKVVITKHLAISGLGIYKGYEQNQNYIGDSVDPLFFFFDLSAKKPDLSDAEYMGEWYYLDVPAILERYQNLSKEEVQAIERYSVNESIDIHRLINNYYSVGGAKVPVYEVYWKDMEIQEYGYVKDPYGYPYFTRINHEESDYTDKDLIEPPENAYKKILKKGQKKAKVYVDVLRYCIFIPKEEVGVGTAQDIILEWGEVPFQEKRKLDPSNVQFPYKCYTWAYDKGEVLSPIDDAIDPQRFINRTLSVAESHINNMRGSGTVIAKDAVDPRDGEENIHRNVNKSKTIFVDTTRVGSVQNAIGQYGSNLGQGTMALFNVIKEMQVSMQDVTGINESMTGTLGASDALVGVVEAQIQRGSLVQEPFYWALTAILTGAYQHMATVGKRIYADNPRKLATMVGDKGAVPIVITKEMMMEDFRAFIKRKQGEESEVANANNLLFTLMQAGMLDQTRVANLFNRADANMVAKAMRDYQAEQLQAQNERAKMQPALAQQAEEENIALAAEQQAAEDQAIAGQNELENEKIQSDIDKTIIKEGAKNEREKMKYQAQGAIEPRS